jgi:hypothetical protein
MKLLKTVGFVLMALAGILALKGLNSFGMHWHPKRSENEVQALSSMRTIQSAQELYHERNGQFAPDLDALISAGYIDKAHLGEKNGYEFKLKLISPDEWEAVTEPALPGESGRRHYFISSIDGKLRMQNYEPANANSYILGSIGEGELNLTFLDKYVYCWRKDAFYFLSAIFVGILAGALFILYSLPTAIRSGEEETGIS